MRLLKSLVPILGRIIPTAAPAASNTAEAPRSMSHASRDFVLLKVILRSVG